MKNADRPINPIVQEEYIAGNRILQCTQAGLTKREHFAGLAMQAVISTINKPDMDSVLEIPKNTAQWAVKFADELLKALESDQ